MCVRLVLAMFLSLSAASAAFGQDAAAPVPAPMKADAKPVVPHELLTFLARDALTALNHANRTGNYAVLRSLGTEAFQADATEQKLAAAFADFRTRKIDLASVLVLEPVLSQEPAIEGGNTVHLAGVFPTKPLAVAFDLRVKRTPLGWRIAGIAVTAEPGMRPQAAAPATPSTQKPARRTAPPKPRPPAAKSVAQKQKAPAAQGVVPMPTIDY